MTRRVVFIVISAVLITVGGLVALGGGALLAVLGPHDTLSSGVQQLSTSTSALVSPVAAIQDSSGVQNVLGTVRLQASAASARPGGQLFIGIAPAAAVDRYLGGVGRDEATDVTLRPFHLTLVRHGGSAAAAPPGAQPFWVARASGTDPAISWQVTDGSYRLVVMNANGTGPVSFDGQVAVTVPHLLAISSGLLGGGLVVLLAGVALLVAGLRTRPGPAAAYPGYAR